MVVKSVGKAITMATKPIPAGTDLNANGNVSEHHVSWGQHHVCGVRAAHQLPITHIPEGSTPGDSKQGPQENTDPNARSTPEGAGRPDQKRKNNKCEESENIERMNCEEVCEESAFRYSPPSRAYFVQTDCPTPANPQPAHRNVSRSHTAPATRTENKWLNATAHPR